MRSVKTEAWKAAQEGHFATWQSYVARDHANDPERRVVWQNILEAATENAPLRAGERILDIGGGLDSVLDFVPGAEAFALDPLAARLKKLGASAHIRASAGVFESLPFADACFDRVFLMNVLDHVHDPRAGLHEIRRVLKSTGMLVLSVDTFHGRRYLERRLHKWWGRVRAARTKHPWVFSVASVQKLMHDAGFEPSPGTHIAATKARRSFFTGSPRGSHGG